MTVSMPEI